MKKSKTILKLKNKKTLIIITLSTLLLLIGIIVATQPNKEVESKQPKEKINKEIKQTNQNEIKATGLKIKDVEIKLGTDLSQIELQYFIENYDKLTKSDLEKFGKIDFEEVDSSKEGTYTYFILYDNDVYKAKIKITTTAEEVVIKTEETKKFAEQQTSTANTTQQNQETQNSESAQPTQPTQPELKIPSGSWSKDGFTITSNGTTNVNISYNGHSATGTAECNNYSSMGIACNVLMGQGPATTDIMFVSMFGPATTNFSFQENQEPTVISNIQTAQSFMDKFNLTYTRQSYTSSLASDSGNNFEVDNKYWNYVSQDYHMEYSYNSVYTYDSNFRCNGIIVVVGKPNGKGVYGTHESYDFEQVYL